jgi:hypothetical protein
MSGLYPNSRKPAMVVKCPHCKWEGSARGIYTHVRLSHPTIAEKPKTATKIVAHPYDVKGLGHVKDKIHRLDKVNHSDWINLLVVPLAIKLFEELLINNGVTLPSKVGKPYRSAIGSVEYKKK